MIDRNKFTDGLTDFDETADRVFALATLRAPEIILQNEKHRLIEALALTRFAKREIHESFPKTAYAAVGETGGIWRLNIRT